MLHARKAVARGQQGDPVNRLAAVLLRRAGHQVGDDVEIRLRKRLMPLLGRGLPDQIEDFCAAVEADLPDPTCLAALYFAMLSHRTAFMG